MPVQQTRPRSPVQQDDRYTPPPQKGDKGDKGEKGDKGDKGDPGQDCDPNVVVSLLIQRIKTDPELVELLKGNDGQDGANGSVIDLTDDEVNNLAKRLPPIYPMWIDDNGSVIDEIPGGVHLNQTMPMRVRIDIELIRKIVKQALAEQGAANAGT